jgi:hypothetical protein
MKSLVEAVASIVLFSLTPVKVVWVVIGLVQVVESIGDAAKSMTRRLLAGCHWAGNSEEAMLDTDPIPVSRRRQPNVVIPNWHNTQFWHRRGAVEVLWVEPTLPLSCATCRRGREWLADIRAHIGCVTRFQFL